MSFVGKGHADVFRLSAGIAARQMRVAEQTCRGVAKELVGRVAIAIGALTHGKIAAFALIALAADDGARDDDPVSHLERRVLLADFDHFAHELVSHDVTEFHAWHEAVE